MIKPKIVAYAASFLASMASVPVAGAQQTLTEDAAQTIVRPIYDALTASSPEMD
jgi:hypothetical protein